MGAVTAILAAEHSQQIKCLILDSPFSSFKSMIHDVVASKKKIPKCFINMVLVFIMKTIRKKTGCDLRKIKPIKVVEKLEMPCFFFVSKHDIISRPDKVKSLYLNYKGNNKQFHLIPGEHQTHRENEILIKAVYFIL